MGLAETNSQELSEDIWDIRECFIDFLYHFKFSYASICNSK
jgi:hypothetical protein